MFYYLKKYNIKYRVTTCDAQLDIYKRVTHNIEKIATYMNRKNNKEIDTYKLCEFCYMIIYDNYHDCDRKILNKYEMCGICYKKTCVGYHTCKGTRAIETYCTKKIPKIIPMFPSFKKKYIKKYQEKIKDEWNNIYICHDLLNIIMLYSNPFVRSKTTLIHKFLL